MDIEAQHNLRKPLSGVGGVLYPRDYVLAAFPDEREAGAARDDLLVGGYDEADVEAMSGRQFADEAERIMTEANALISGLGAENKVTDHYRELAAANHGIVLAYAPSGQETERVMRVFRRHGADTAHKYHRFTIESLISEAA